ncbi:uncharacterized protein LOC141954649 [Strix uralensis]|uniref:uncharacterized protein LOC141954649 n=1 Tax=Strix uralensis TaxID=36305 RepID=UPI003DA758C8
MGTLLRVLSITPRHQQGEEVGQSPQPLSCWEPRAGPGEQGLRHPGGYPPKSVPRFPSPGDIHLESQEGTFWSFSPKSLCFPAAHTGRRANGSPRSPSRGDAGGRSGAAWANEMVHQLCAQALPSVLLQRGQSLCWAERGVVTPSGGFTRWIQGLPAHPPTYPPPPPPPHRVLHATGRGPGGRGERRGAAALGGRRRAARPRVPQGLPESRRLPRGSCRARSILPPARPAGTGTGTGTGTGGINIDPDIGIHNWHQHRHRRRYQHQHRHRHRYRQRHRYRRWQRLRGAQPGSLVSLSSVPAPKDSGTLARPPLESDSQGDAGQSQRGPSRESPSLSLVGSLAGWETPGGGTARPGSGVGPWARGRRSARPGWRVPGLA